MWNDRQAGHEGLPIFVDVAHSILVFLYIGNLPMDKGDLKESERYIPTRIQSKIFLIGCRIFYVASLFLPFHVIFLLLSGHTIFPYSHCPQKALFLIMGAPAACLAALS